MPPTIAKRYGKLEILLLTLVVIATVLWLIPGNTVLESIVTLSASITALFVFTRYWKRIVEKLLWRLRNRLIVAYLLIALVPVVLLSSMILLCVYIVLGQVSVHLLNAQLVRNTGMLHGAMRLVASTKFGSSMELWKAVPPAIATAFPGLEVIEQEGETTRHWPEASQLTPPPAGWNETDGLVLRDNKLYGWTHVKDHDRKVTAVFPITRDYLGEIAPNLGESVVLDRTLRGSLTSGVPRKEGTLNRVPPAVNTFDRQINWPSPIMVSQWEQPGDGREAFIVMSTRPSAVLRTISPDANSANLMIWWLVALSVLFLFAEVIAFFVGISITRTITGAVHDIYQGTARVMSGDFSHRIPILGRDQLAELATSFNDMTGNVERLLQVEKDRQRIQTDLEIAREVQDQLYPRVVPTTDDICITASRNPARLVSGDYYDFQTLSDGNVALVIGDVAGKGISAALLMATLQSSFRMELRSTLAANAMATSGSAGSILTSTYVSPSDIVSHLNKHLYEFTSPEKYATFLCAVYEKASSELVYCNAGHLPPILVRDGKCSRLDVNGMVVGAFPFAAYEESRLVMERGDLLVLFTDGISEPENEYGEMFGEERIAEIATRLAGSDDQKIVDEIVAAVMQWTGSDELQDDMTLLLLRRK